MADKKISQLNSASLPLAGTEVVPIVQGGETKKVAISELSGAVDSVNGQIGVVVLDADDVVAVPRGGTTVGNPIIGALQMADGTEIYSENSTKSSIFFEDGYLYIKFLNALSEESQFLLSDLGLSISSLTSGFRGLIGSDDFTPNITDLDYTQKKYVDTKQPIEVPATTGVSLTFATDRIYGSIATPETGNITASTTGAKLGVTNIIIHNSGTAPTFDSKFKKLSGSGSYVVGVVNYIYCTYITPTEIIYSINQRA